MIERKSAKQILDHLAAQVERMPEKMPNSQQEFSSYLAIESATYDVLCGIEDQLGEITYALTHINRALLAKATDGMEVQVIPHPTPNETDTLKKG